MKGEGNQMKRMEDWREMGESKEADKGMEKKKALEDESEGEKWNKKDIGTSRIKREQKEESEGKDWEEENIGVERDGQSDKGGMKEA